MKKTQVKDAVRNIRKRIVSYLSLCLVIMLGLGGMFTTSYMGAGLNEKTTEYYNDHNFKDFEMISSVGLSRANIDRLKATDNVTAAEGVIQTRGSLVSGSLKSKVEVISLTREVSVPDLTEGVYPTARDECMIAEDFAETEGIKVGDKVSLSLTGLSMSDTDLTDTDFTAKDSDEDPDEEKSEDGNKKKEEKALHEKVFTVTGLGHHPDYLRRKAVNLVILPLPAFNENVTKGLFTRAFIKTAEPENTDIFSDEYFEKTADIKAMLEKMTEVLADDRADEMKAEANDHIDKEWAKAEADLAAAQSEIDSGETNLYDKLAKGKKKLNDTEAKLEKELDEANKKLRKGELTIAEYEKKLNAGKKELAKKKKELESGKKEFEKGKKELEEKKKQLQEAIEMFGGKQQIDEIYDFAVEAKEMIAEIDEMTDPQEKDAAVRELGLFLTQHDSQIRKVFDYIGDPDVLKKLDKLQEHTKKDFMKTVNTLNAIGYEGFMDTARGMADGTVPYESVRDMIRDILDSIIALIDGIREGEDKIAEAEKKISDAGKKIKEGEKLIADGEKLLKNGEKELNEKKDELEDGKKLVKSKKREAEKKIKAGWNKYYSEKNKYESKLEEAKALLAENRELAEKKLSEARAEVDKMDCTWILLDRRANAGFVDIGSNLKAVDMMAVVFGMMFLIITAVVCFSTLAIIIDEQKTLVGTAKAFGFTKGEVAKKYLMFGVSAAVIGSILSVTGAYLLANFVQKVYARTGMYSIGVARSIITGKITVIACLMITAVTVIASLIACADILRSPASVLMKGAVLKKSDNKPKKKKVVSRKGSLYSRLIFRNMLDDKARVLVTVAIIAFSCFLMGLGITMKLAFDGMMERQINDVNKYDMMVMMGDDITDEDESELISVLAGKGVSYLPATSETKLYRWDGRLDGLTLICADPEELGEYYAVTDAKTGEALSLPDDGVLIQKRMHESYNMNEGDMLPLYDSGLGEHEARIKGNFINYVGRMAVVSPKAYKEIFGDENEENCFFIKLNGVDAEVLKDDLIAVTDDLSFGAKDEFRMQFESASQLYNVLVYITTGIAILISFMILTNLSNIYLSRKKTELTVMRINGFSIRQTKGYLSRESIATTGAGIVLGVIIGAIISPPLIALIQQPDLEFIKSFQVTAWVSAVGLEALFAIIINTIVFRKVKDLNFRDIE